MKSQNAFSLLEIIIALFLFSIGIIAVASMQILTRNQLSSVTQSLDNSFSAVAFLEQLIGLDYHDPLLIDTDNGFNPEIPDYGPEPIGSNSTIEWEVDDDFPVLHTKRITITIRQFDPGGLQRSIRYDYIKCRDFI